MFLPGFPFLMTTAGRNILLWAAGGLAVAAIIQDQAAKAAIAGTSPGGGLVAPSGGGTSTPIDTSGAPLGIRNNNPGNLRDSGISWQGRVGGNQGFVVFDTAQNGLRALAKDLITKSKRGLNTIATIIPVYAPPSENNTAAYIAQVASQTGFDPNQLLQPDEGTLDALSNAIIVVEQGYNPYADDMIMAAVDAALASA